MKVKYEANDGTLFDNEQACKAYETPEPFNVLVEPEYIYQVKMPYSEVCIHMKVVDKVMGVELLPDSRSVQLWEPIVKGDFIDWKQFSIPILASEAGLYFEPHDDEGATGHWYFTTRKSTEAFKRWRVFRNGKDFNVVIGGEEYSDGETWFDEKYLCRACATQCDIDNKPYQFADERYSLGIYAMKACDDCWGKAGYRKEGVEGFDPSYAGESYDSD